MLFPEGFLKSLVIYGFGSSYRLFFSFMLQIFDYTRENRKENDQEDGGMKIILNNGKIA